MKPHTLRLEPNGFTCSCGYEELSAQRVAGEVVTSRAAMHMADVQNPSPSKARRTIRHDSVSGVDPSSAGLIVTLVGGIHCCIHGERAHVDAAVGNVVGIHGCCQTLLNQVEQPSSGCPPANFSLQLANRRYAGPALKRLHQRVRRRHVRCRSLPPHERLSRQRPRRVALECGAACS
jgi:hypothetical protein